jgi:hypothetical protein
MKLMQRFFEGNTIEGEKRMPNPADYKGDKDKFISDCMRTVSKEDPSKTQEQKAGKCYGMWKNYKKKKEAICDSIREIANKL